MPDWIKTYLGLLDALRREDGGHSVFGSKQHQYKLRSPLNEPQIVEIEDRFECSLPVDYRRYLLEVSDGGAGPGTGIFSLNRASQISDCGRDFPFDSQHDFYPPSDGPHSYDDAHRGALVISHYGCSMFAMLVVRGDSASQVWYDGEDYIKPLATRFSAWLLEWANSALTDLRGKP